MVVYFLPRYIAMGTYAGNQICSSLRYEINKTTIKKCVNIEKISSLSCLTL